MKEYSDVMVACDILLCEQKIEITNIKNVWKGTKLRV